MTVIERIRYIHWGWKVLFFIGLWFAFRELVGTVFFAIGYVMGVIQGVAK